MAAWDPSLGFCSFRDTTQAAYVLLHCIRATVSGHSQLSPAETDALLAWGQREIPRLHQWLRNLEWSGLHTGCLAITADLAATLVFPHVASKFLVRNIINPLIALCSEPGGLAFVCKDLVSDVKHAWHSALLAYPDSVNSDAAFVWCTALDQIESRLERLQTLVGTQ